MFKQLIIARRDLNMSPGKLAAQVSHASIAFLLEKLYYSINRTACVEENNRYPRLEYIPTMWRSDAINIKLENGYILKGYETMDKVLVWFDGKH